MVCHQLFHHAVFLLRQRKFHVVAGQDAGLDIQCQIAKGQEVGMEFLPPPQHGPDTGQKLAHGKGFGQIVIRAGIQPPDAVGNLGLCGEEQNRGFAPAFSQGGQNVQAVAFRHHNIQDDSVIITGYGVNDIVVIS